MTGRTRKLRPKRMAQDAWLVRWTLAGEPKVLPADMFCTIPGSVVNARLTLFWLAGHDRDSTSPVIFGWEPNWFNLDIPVFWPRPAILQDYLAHDVNCISGGWRGISMTEYQFRTLERAHWGTRRVILAVTKAGLV